MTAVRVSAVIVSYKTAELTVGCLRSLARERETARIELEAIVVDNASGDAALIRRAIEREGYGAWVTLIEAERNGGYAYGNNLGFRHAYEARRAPDYFHLLNPDTVVRPGAVQELVDFLERRPDVGIAGSSFENQDGSEWRYVFRFPTLWAGIDSGVQWGLVSKLLERYIVASPPMGSGPERADWLPGASMMIRRQVIDEVGGLDEGYFLYFEETDFCWRANEAGWPCWYVPGSRVMHIAGQSTKMTERHAAPKRLPGYWYESRRRFYLSRYGLRYAIANDLACAAAHGLGRVKTLLLRRDRDGAVPHFVTDLLRTSVLWPRNRAISAPSCYRPPPAGAGAGAERRRTASTV